MKEYLLLLRGGNAHQSKEAMAKNMESWKQWMGKLAQDGKLSGGQPLTEGGKIMTNKGAKITDGPFAESKEVVSGYLLIKAADYNEATKLSKDCPIFELDGIIEVREIGNMDM